MTMRKMLIALAVIAVVPAHAQTNSVQDSVALTIGRLEIANASLTAQNVELQRQLAEAQAKIKTSQPAEPEK